MVKVCAKISPTRCPPASPEPRDGGQAPGFFHTMTIADDLFVGISEKIKEIRTIIPQVADTNSTVLISGESGTEKPLSRITNIS